MINLIIQQLVRRRAPGFKRGAEPGVVAHFLLIVASDASIEAAAWRGLATPSRLQHFVYFGRDPDRGSDHPSRQRQRFVGAHIIYSRKELEPRQDAYAFDAIEADLLILNTHGLSGGFSGKKPLSSE